MVRGSDANFSRTLSRFWICCREPLDPSATLCLPHISVSSAWETTCMENSLIFIHNAVDDPVRIRQAIGFARF